MDKDDEDGRDGTGEDNLDESPTIMDNDKSRTGSSNQHMSLSPPPPAELPAVTVGGLHQQRNSEHFELDPEFTQPLQLSQAMAEIQRLTTEFEKLRINLMRRQQTVPWQLERS